MVAAGATTVQAIYALSALSSAVLAVIIWRHRERTGARELLVATLAALWWALALFVAATVGEPTLAVLAVKSAYLGVVVSVAASFLFALAYTGREHLVNRRVIGLLSIEPAIVLALVFANPDDVFFTAIEAVPTDPMGVDLALGPAFFLHALYSYVLVFAVAALILGMLYRTRAVYRGQLLVLVGAVVVPLVANAVAIAGYVNFDSTPVGFVLASTLYTIAIVRYRLIDLVPIARDRLVNNVTDAMFVVDTDDRLVDVNPAGEALASDVVDEGDLIGRNVRDLLVGLPELETIYEDIVAGDDEGRMEFSIEGNHYQAEATPIDDSRDRTVGWLFLVRDITERKEREQQLRERNEQLDKFASVVSHDLRNPLQVAAGRVELARETGDTVHLDEVEDALDRMESIIDDVLSLARGGDAVTDPAPVSLAAVAREAWANVETAGATISIDTEARIVADRDRLARLLENLFRNAVEHGSTSPPSHAQEDAVEHGSTSPRSQAREDAVEHGATEETAGGPTDAGPTAEGLLVQEGGTDLDAVGDDESGSTVSIHVGDFESEAGPGFFVADDGPGIPSEDRETVFESGYSTDEDGTGFGLTIVSQIANAHGWAVRATESESGGARFEIVGVERAD